MYVRKTISLVALERISAWAKKQLYEYGTLMVVLVSTRVSPNFLRFENRHFRWLLRAYLFVGTKGKTLCLYTLYNAFLFSEGFRAGAIAVNCRHGVVLACTAIVKKGQFSAKDAWSLCYGAGFCIAVHRQRYFGGAFIGNHVYKAL